MDRQQAFRKLKPACIYLLQVTATIAQDPTARSDLDRALRDLALVLEGIPPKVLDQKLTEYAFVPISQVLRSSRTVPVRALESCLKCIVILLRSGWGDALSFELAGQLLILFTFMAKPSSAGSGISNSSEELQTLALACLAELFVQMSRLSGGKQQITSTANIPSLGEAILVILDSLAESTSNTVKLQAARALALLIECIEDKDALASFLPRMVSSLTKVVTPTTANQAGFRVLEKSIQTLRALFQLLLSDEAAENLPTLPDTSKETSGTIVRSTSWLQATASQIKLALSNILKLQHHGKEQVRSALLQFCLLILQDCQASLKDCTGMALETMIVLAGHAGSGNSVEKELRILMTSNQRLSDLLRESLRNWVIAMPRLMRSRDDSGRRDLVHQLSVVLRLLEGQQVILNDLLADNIRDGVSAVLSESRDAKPMAVAPSSSFSGNELVLSDRAGPSFAAIKLRYKGQDDMMTAYTSLLAELSKSDGAITIAQELVSTVYAGSQENRLASYWISINLLRGIIVNNAPIDDFVDLGNSNMHEDLLDDLYLYSLRILGEDADFYNNGWQFQALALEALAMQASQHGVAFRSELSEVLYPILHHLGSSNQQLQSHAITCLNSVSRACGYDTASTLVVDNADYIVNDVGLKLSAGDVSPQAPQVLLMMLRLCGPSLLPYVDDLVGNIFISLESFHGYSKLVELLFAVLQGMVEEGVKDPQLAITADADPKATDPRSERISNLLKAVEKMDDDYVERQEEDEIEDVLRPSFPRKPWKETDALTAPRDEAAEDEPADEVARQSDPPPPAPRIYLLVLKISSLTQHHLTSASPSLRASLLSLLQTSIPALSKHENSFLPLINTLWPVLLPRLQDHEAYVVEGALEVVTLLCEHAGAFMTSRIESAWHILRAVHARATITSVNATATASSNRTKAIAQPSQSNTEAASVQQAKHSSTTTAHAKSLKPTRLSDLHNIANADSSLSSSSKSADAALTARSTTSFTASSSARAAQGYCSETGSFYTTAPTRMLWTALVPLLCTLSRRVTIREELWDDVLDMLGPLLDAGVDDDLGVDVDLYIHAPDGAVDATTRLPDGSTYSAKRGTKSDANRQQRDDVRRALEERNADAVWLRLWRTRVSIKGEDWARAYHVARMPEKGKEWGLWCGVER